MGTILRATFVNVRTNTFILVKTDVHNKRVTTIAGRIGTRGRKTVRTFESNAAVRAKSDSIIDSRIDGGFVQVA